MDFVQVNDADTLDNKYVFPPGSTENIEETFGFPHRAVHCVDLHNTLKELALRDDGRGPRFELYLGVRVVRVDFEADAELKALMRPGRQSFILLYQGEVLSLI